MKGFFYFIASIHECETSSAYALKLCVHIDVFVVKEKSYNLCISIIHTPFRERQTKTEYP